MARIATHSPAPLTDAKRSVRKHLPFLDGIRGLAALYVVLDHAAGITNGFAPPEGRTRLILQSLEHGLISVSVFIVLSGYCLALPCLRTAREIRLDRASFCLKRAWRILPPYYAALLLAICVDPIVQTPIFAWTQLSFGNVIAHITLFHDLRLNWVLSVCPPLWSVAVEWHIYFIFAFILFPLWRRLGIQSALLLALTLGILPHVFSKTHCLDWAHPWYLFLFSMGMLAASVTETDSPKAFAHFIMRYNTALLVGGAILLFAVFSIKSRLGDNLFLIADIIEGMLTATLIIRFNAEWSRDRRSLTLRLLESPVALGLGAMSYSLYLMHWPVLAVLNYLLGSHLDAEGRSWILLLVGTPVAVMFSFASYLLIERPLMRKRRSAVVPQSAPEPTSLNATTNELLVQL